MRGCAQGRDLHQFVGVQFQGLRTIPAAVQKIQDKTAGHSHEALEREANVWQISTNHWGSFALSKPDAQHNLVFNSSTLR